MHCTQHPSQTPIGVCASCLGERLTHLLQLQRNAFSLPISQPPPPPPPFLSPDPQSSLPNSQQFTDKKPAGGKFSFSSRFKQGQSQGQSKPKTHTEKIQGYSEVGNSAPSRGLKEKEKEKENGADTRKPRAISAWISGLLPRRHREKSHMPAAAAAAKINPSFMSARSSDERNANDADFVTNSGPLPYEFEGYYSDSDLTRRRGGGGGGIFPRLKRRVEITEREKGKGNSSATARVNIFSESEEEGEGDDFECRRASPLVDLPRRGNFKSSFSGFLASPTPKGKRWVGAGDCAGSFSPYTDRKRPLSMPRTENSGFAFCPSPRKLFHREISRSPRPGGKLSTFFFSPSRRTT